MQFRSMIWEALLDAERRANGADVMVEEMAPGPRREGWEVQSRMARGELLRRAAAAAVALRARVAAFADAGPPVVALALPRSADYVVLALAALAAGAAFMPLEESDARVAVLAARAGGAEVLVVTGRKEAVAAAAAAATGAPGGGQRRLNVLSAGELLLTPAPDAAADGPSPPPCAPLPYYCLMPTSGSTVAATAAAGGGGKTVLLTESALLRRCRWALDEADDDDDEEEEQEGNDEQQQQQRHPRSLPLLASGDAVALTTSPSFVDHLAQQLFAPLLFVGGGGCEPGPLPRRALRLVIVRERPAEEREEQQHEQRRRHLPPPPLLARPRALLDALSAARATHFVAVPSVLAGMVAVVSSAAASWPSSLRCLISSGEPLPVPLAKELLLLLLGGAAGGGGARRLLNLYGSTETSGDCAWLDVGWWLRSQVGGAAAATAEEPRAGCVPAGLPLDRSVRIRLRGDEVLVGGGCVAAGYYCGREQEEDVGAFWEEEDPGAGGHRRWYATGDRGRLSAGGGGGLLLLHVDGRLDDPSFAKVHGARVDCGAVEAALLKASGGAAVAVRAWPARGLVAYVEQQQREEAGAVAASSDETRPRLLSAHRAEDAPLLAAFERAADDAGLLSRARPAMYVSVPSFPRSPAGKLLRALLPEPEPTTAAAAATAEGGPRRPMTERDLLAALQAALDSVVGSDGGTRLEPAEDVLERGGGAASRVAVAAAALLGVPPPLVLAFPSARALCRALVGESDGGGFVGEEAAKKRPREEEDEWRPADEVCCSVLSMCVDASPVVLGSSRGGNAVAAASHGGEVAVFALVDGAEAVDKIARARLPGSLDAGLVPVGPSLLAVVCRQGEGGGGGEPAAGGAAGASSSCSLHLAAAVSDGGDASAPLLEPLALPSHVSSAPAAWMSDDGARCLIFLATHAPDPRLVVVVVDAVVAARGVDRPPSWRIAATAPLPAPSASTPLVLPLPADKGKGVAVEVVVATLDGALACFAVEKEAGAGAVAAREDEGGGGGGGGNGGDGVAIRQLWHCPAAAASSSSPIFGAPVALPLVAAGGQQGGALLVLAAHVDGRVRAVWGRESCGAVAWETERLVGGSAAAGRGGGGPIGGPGGGGGGGPGGGGREEQGGAAPLPPPPPPLFARLAVLTGAVNAMVVVAATDDGSLHGLDGLTGRVLWRLALRGGAGRGDRGLCSPAVVGAGGGVLGLVVAAHDGRVFGVRVEGASARVVSEQRVPAAVYGSPVVVVLASGKEAGGCEEGGGAKTMAALVAIGCRDDRVRVVRVKF
jgi:acyl-CoA synthetase (AMP-forming)/AMP-acid ligase II